MSRPSPSLPPPASYFPVRSQYDVAPALRPLGTPFGNDRVDALLFQLDTRFPELRQNKLQARAERLGKYHLQGPYPREVERAVTRFLVRRLPEEHPDWFYAEAGEQGTRLQCRLTGERLDFTPEWDWLPAPLPGIDPPYATALDALACQVAEDLAVTVTDDRGGDWLGALHVCSPSAWVPEEKIGLPFTRVHEPVPGMERLAPYAPSLVRTTVERGPFVRFVWALAGDDRWNHHPEPPPGVSPEAWRLPAFRPEADPPFTFRVERQVLWGLPEVGACLFAIGPYHTDPHEIRADPHRRTLLAAALRSLSPASRAYKGLEGSLEPLLAWLEGKSQ